MKLFRFLGLAVAAALTLAAPAAEAFTYATAIKTARMTATRDNLAGGSIEVLHSDGTTVCVTFPLSTTGGTVSTDTWTIKFSGATEATSVTATATAATCTATSARVKTSGGTANITGLTVSTAGANINLNNTSITSGQSVTLSSATLQHAP